MLTEVVIDGMRGQAAYLDANWRLVSADSPDAVMAKVVFENGRRAFYAVEADGARSAYSADQPRTSQMSILDSPASATTQQREGQ